MAGLGLMGALRGAALLSFGALASFAANQEFTLTILHTNDLHARVEPASVQGKMLGGYARQAYLAKKYLAEDPNAILLNAGDTFQGTLYFSVYEGLADVAFMNAAGYQAMAVGNHEFDRGPKALRAFAQAAAFPLLAANLDAEREPELAGRIRASTVLQVGGQRVGVVGAITPELPVISSPGPNVELKDLVTSVQGAIEDLAKQGVNKIVVLSHVGYREELELARKLRGVDVLVGGHSHTYLGESLDRLASSGGPYPTVVTNADGDTTLVVQAWDWGKVLGRIKVVFDERGKVTRWFDAKPILVDESVPEDPAVRSLVLALARPIAALANKPIGEAAIPITREGSYDGETLMGNLITDAMLEATEKDGAVAAFMNAGGIRANFDAGTITYGQAVAVQPFNNTLVLLDLTGAEIVAALESGLTKGFLHVSRGMRYRIDRSRPEGSRIRDVRISGEPLEPTRTYRVCLNSFIASGGDAHEVLKNARGRRVDTGMLDVDALVAYVGKHSPVKPMLEGRIAVDRPVPALARLNYTGVGTSPDSRMRRTASSNRSPFRSPRSVRDMRTYPSPSLP